MLGTRTDLIFLERQRPGLTAQPSIHTTRIAKLIARLAPPPHRRSMRAAVAALGPEVVRIGLIRRRPVVVCVDELLRPEFVPLLEVEPAGVAERLHRRWVASPERGRGGVAVRAAFG